MTLSIGDHVVIKRGDHIVTPDEEAFHEYEVVSGTGQNGGIDYIEDPESPFESKRQTTVTLRVVK